MSDAPTKEYDVIIAGAGHGRAQAAAALRTRVDADRMRAELGGVRRPVVIGGGYARQDWQAPYGAGSAGPPLARVASEPLSRFYKTDHRANGVGVRLGVAASASRRQAAGFAASGLRTGRCSPATWWWSASGSSRRSNRCSRRVPRAITGSAWIPSAAPASPDVFAVADCALHLNRYAAGGAIRLESVQNANDQATIVTKALTGAQVAYDAVPWFWSYQYDLKLRTIGLFVGHSQAVVRGDPATAASRSPTSGMAG